MPLMCTCIILAVPPSIFAFDTKTIPPTDSTAGTVFPGEKHLTNIRKLTFGGQNAEAYFNADASQIIFQSARDGHDCDAIYRMNADGSSVRMVSNGKGATTCPFIQPDGKAITYASTHLGGDSCPPKPDMSRGYVWALYPTYDIFKADPDGSNIVRLTSTDGYDAEAVYSFDGKKIIFTSVRTGDLELFTMDPDGKNVEQITNMPGYDGGAWFSWDGKWICWRASRPEGDALKEYQDLLKQGLIRPSKLEIYVMNLADRKPIRLTDNGAANFAPFFHPDGKRVIYSSNMNDPQKRNFDLYMVDIATKKIEQITFNATFDGFPMFSPDGTKLVFGSNRNGSVPHETNIFIADWHD
ncbi:MAG: PD40 domain-containing protein [candidate division Zixibacteria bacterium]|nr:PD40 domain-containing protein [candidate division Zixibacteria bacterium]